VRSAERKKQAMHSVNPLAGKTRGSGPQSFSLSNRGDGGRSKLTIDESGYRKGGGEFGGAAKPARFQGGVYNDSRNHG